MNRVDLVIAVRRRALLVLAVVLVASAAVYLRSAAMEEVHRAAVELQATAAGDVSDARSAAALARRAAALVGSRDVVSAQARDDVHAEVVGDAGLLRIEAEASTAAEAEVLARRVAARLVDEIAEREEATRAEVVRRTTAEAAAAQQRLAATEAGTPERERAQAELQAVLAVQAEARVRPAARLDVTRPAQTASAQVSPTPVRDASIAALVGLLLGIAAAVALERRHDAFTRGRVAEQVEALTGLPVLAAVPRGGDGDFVEAVRALRTSLMYVPSPDRLRTLAVVGNERGIGRSTIAEALAAEAAGIGVPVTLVDADLRDAVVTDEPGLSDVLAGLPLTQALRPQAQCLEVMPSGSPVDDPPGLLAAAPLADVLDAIPDAELVVVDTPAADVWADALAIASQCDATLLVISVERSSRRSFAGLVERLRRVGANPIGVVVDA